MRTYFHLRIGPLIYVDIIKKIGLVLSCGYHFMCYFISSKNASYELSDAIFLGKKRQSKETSDGRKVAGNKPFLYFFLFFFAFFIILLWTDSLLLPLLFFLFIFFLVHH